LVKVTKNTKTRKCVFQNIDFRKPFKFIGRGSRSDVPLQKAEEKDVLYNFGWGQKKQRKTRD